MPASLPTGGALYCCCNRLRHWQDRGLVGDSCRVVKQSCINDLSSCSLSKASHELLGTCLLCHNCRLSKIGQFTHSRAVCSCSGPCVQASRGQALGDSLTGSPQC